MKKNNGKIIRVDNGNYLGFHFLLLFSCDALVLEIHASDDIGESRRLCLPEREVEVKKGRFRHVDVGQLPVGNLA